MKKFTKVYEEFKESVFDGPNNHVKFMNWLTDASPEEIKHAFHEGKIDSPLKKKIAAQNLGKVIGSGSADQSIQEIFHLLSDKIK